MSLLKSGFRKSFGSVTPFVLSLSKHGRGSPFDKLRTNGVFECGEG